MWYFMLQISRAKLYNRGRPACAVLCMLCQSTSFHISPLHSAIRNLPVVTMYAYQKVLARNVCPAALPSTRSNRLLNPTPLSCLQKHPHVQKHYIRPLLSNHGRNLLRPVASVKFEGPVPEGVEVEIKGPEDGVEVEWNPDTKVLRLPFSVIEASGERRTKLVIFTCNKCGGRTARNVNPVAWEKGLVMGQCAHCEVWHVLSAKNPLIFEEIRYKDGNKVSSTSDPEFYTSSSTTSDSTSGTGDDNLEGVSSNG